MADYGDIDYVKTMLRPNEATAYGSDIDTRLATVQRAVSRRLERELGWDRADDTMTVYAGAGPILLLPTPARSISSVTIGGTQSAGTITSGTVLSPDYWHYFPVDAVGRILGIRLNSGGDWGGSSASGTPLTPVVIVGDFTVPNSDDEIPDDVTYAANLLILRTFQRENTGVAGVSSEDGSFRPPLDPWKEPFVKGVIARFAVPRVPVF